MEIIQDKNSRSGLIGTILIHLLLLLLFLQFGMPYQDPPEENQGGMIINFGTSDDGSGEEQPTEPASSSSSPSAAEEQIISQDNTETINVNASEIPTTVVEEKPTVSDDLSRALDALNNAPDNNEGETGKAGDQGDPDGDPNSNNRTGGNNGEGIGYDLGGRGKVSFKKPENPTQEDGNVVVDIVVDKYGKVIKATPGARGSTTTNPILYKMAKEAALKARFTPKMDAPTDQKGTMTFVFILN
ncbi:MAG: energy transducer TonB [Vicingus serpentipes]|nr:energy transducer TonB [Vicingus serpentipes]